MRSPALRVPKSASLADRIALGRSADYWRRALDAADATELAQLRPQMETARHARESLSALIQKAENRLQLPRIGSNAFPHPDHADWTWRPDLFRGPLAQRGRSGVPTRTTLGHEATLFHDSALCEITLAQLRNSRSEDLAPYGLELEVFRFEGSFLSVVIDLPRAAAENLKARHLIRFQPIVECENPIEIYARLNVQHGPNCEQLVSKLPLDDPDCAVEFDLSYSDFNEKRSERLWLDLIFDNPEMNRITIRDMTFSRFPRAEL